MRSFPQMLSRNPYRSKPLTSSAAVFMYFLSGNYGLPLEVLGPVPLRYFSNCSCTNRPAATRYLVDVSRRIGLIHHWVHALALLIPRRRANPDDAIFLENLD